MQGGTVCQEGKVTFHEDPEEEAVGAMEHGEEVGEAGAQKEGDSVEEYGSGEEGPVCTGCHLDRHVDNNALKGIPIDFDDETEYHDDLKGVVDNTTEVEYGAGDVWVCCWSRGGDS